MSETFNVENDKRHGLQDMAATIGSVVRAADELGTDKNATLLELPAEAFERADEIYKETKPE